MKTRERLTHSVIERLAAAIEDARGNELFVVGSLDNDRLVFDIKVAARGDDSSVPALGSYIEKGDVVIHNHPSGNLTPSGADLSIASRLGDQGIGFYIIDNTLSEVYVVAEPIVPERQTPLDTAALAAVLLPGGGLSAVSDQYEERPTQVDMLRAICEAFNQDEICIAEAGTGVGKSFAYLVPVIDWVSKNTERVVVSTATINLQQQLIEKDIPLVKKILGVDPKTVLVKGRGNYVCLNRLNEAVGEFSLFEETTDELKSIHEWALTSETGSKSDISFYPRPEVWSRICSEADLCSGLWCKYREGCFVLKAKREAASARLLVANHHLLFSDLSVRMAGIGFEGTAVLPPFHRIVFDEAHNIEESATSFFSRSLTKFSLFKHCGRFHRKKKGRSFGLIYGIAAKIKEKSLIETIPRMIEDIYTQMLLVEHGCLALLGESTELRIRDNEDRQLKEFFLDPLVDLQFKIVDLASVLDNILTEFENAEGDKNLLFESKAQVTRLLEISGLCERFKNIASDTGYIYWIQRSKSFSGDFYIKAIVTPLHIAPLMKEAIYEPYSTVVSTSATLAVNNSFSYWKSRVGLHDIEVMEECFLSPFNYCEQVLLGVPTDAPMPDEEGFQGYVSGFIHDVIGCSGGKALVLFTSYSMLNRTYAEIVPMLREKGICVLKQGDDDRARLLSRFKRDIESVLFATDSFWEGIDTPGDALELLVLCRLPFRVPTGPVVKARMEEIEKNGGNPFFEYSLPEAVIKFRQGFGRLMRRRSDRGVVIVLDSRLVKKSYGPIFLKSLPHTPAIIDSGVRVLEGVADFYASIRK
ncbi:MAG: DEAD/DEAH box helicase [Spirochaetales bacterium]|nr:DEAD/DEAH box helicase [Spirochaetales bacterium]